MRRILRGSAALRSDPLKTGTQTPDSARMENISPIDILIALTVLGAMIAILHAVAADISYTHLRIDLARRVIERRERYLRELRGEHELGGHGGEGLGPARVVGAIRQQDGARALLVAVRGGGRGRGRISG